MVNEALIVCIAYLVIATIDLLLGWQCFTRPIVLGPVIGLVLGDITTGIVLGASLEAIFMGISAIGGSIPSDPGSATVITVAFTILIGQNTETGLALALPIGTLVIGVMGILMPVFTALVSYWEKLAGEGRIKKLMILSFGQMFVFNLLGAVLIFFAIAYGAEGLGGLMGGGGGGGEPPAWLMSSLIAASSMMIGVGISILTSMIWSPKVGVFFFLGFVLSQLLELSILAIAIIGATIAITIFFRDKEIIDLKNSLGKESKSSKEEGFFA